jgi:hypothetical protein
MGGFLFYRIFIVMEKTSPAIKFIQTTKVDEELYDVYRSFRIVLKKAGFKEEDLSRVSEATPTVWRVFNVVSNLFKNIVKEVKQYGFDENEVIEYLQDKLEEINKETPLN